ncbi:MAG: histidinol-phosphate transaminase [Steroidobacteraceae bacterium]
MSGILERARPEIRSLKPYEHAEWDPTLERLHANELPWRAVGDDSSAGLNRYPEPQPRALVVRLSELYGVAPASVLAGRGSDEAIDLLVRAFCRAGEDAVVICPPTFGMYAIAAHIQGAGVKSVALRAEAGFELDAAAVLDACSPEVKLIFLCSPNNPTGNRFAERELTRVIEATAERALVVLDEAYVEFAAAPSLASKIERWPHLVILRTLSKAYGLAGARCGALIAHPDIVALLRKIIPPYAIAQLTVEAALKLLAPAQIAVSASRRELLCAERARLASALARLDGVTRVWPSEANFVLVDFADAGRALARARAALLLVRDVRHHATLGTALRITIGTPEQNDRLLEALR